MRPDGAEARTGEQESGLQRRKRANCSPGSLRFGDLPPISGRQREAKAGFGTGNRPLGSFSDESGERRDALAGKNGGKRNGHPAGRTGHPRNRIFKIGGSGRYN